MNKKEEALWRSVRYLVVRPIVSRVNRAERRRLKLEQQEQERLQQLELQKQLPEIQQQLKLQKQKQQMEQFRQQQLFITTPEMRKMDLLIGYMIPVNNPTDPSSYDHDNVKKYNNLLRSLCMGVNGMKEISNSITSNKDDIHTYKQYRKYYFGYKRHIVQLLARELERYFESIGRQDRIGTIQSIIYRIVGIVKCISKSTVNKSLEGKYKS
jgi:hypothetical protein